MKFNTSNNDIQIRTDTATATADHECMWSSMRIQDAPNFVYRSDQIAGIVRNIHIEVWTNYYR